MGAGSSKPNSSSDPSSEPTSPYSNAFLKSVVFVIVPLGLDTVYLYTGYPGFWILPDKLSSDFYSAGVDYIF